MKKKYKFGLPFLVLWALVGLTVLSTSTSLFAQSYTATLEGLITDPSGAVIPRAMLSLASEATNVSRNVESDALGHYFFALIPPGSYRLRATAPGFKTYERSRMVLEVQQAARVDVQLVPGAVTTKIEVTGEAPRLDSVNATEGRVVSNQSMLDLPVAAESRDPTAFAQLVPGVVPVGGYKSGGGTNFSANGGRISATDILLDGASTSVMEHNSGIEGFQYHPDVESVQEFKVQTNSFTAEYGNTTTAIINMVTRSGSNQLHGDVFEFNRVNALQASSFFSNKAGGKLGRYIYNRYGGVLGGPVYIPKVWDGRNKTFFFFHYERNQVPSSPQQNYSTVPTAAERQGDFSGDVNSDGSPVVIYDPTTSYKDTVTGKWTRLPFTNNIVPLTSWNAVAKAAIPYYPSPTSTGTGVLHLNNFYSQGIASSSWNEMTIKIDHNFTDRQRLSSRYSRDYSISQSPSDFWGNCPSSAASLPYCQLGNFMVPSGHTYSSNKQQNGMADYTNTINPNTVLNLRVGASRLNAPTAIFGETGFFDTKTLGFTTPNMQVQRAPSFGMQNYSFLGPSIWTGSLNAATNTDVIGTLTKVKGKHTIKTGTDLRFQYLNYAQPPLSTASFIFCQNETMQYPDFPNSKQGNSLASLMMGWGSNTGCVQYNTGQGFNPVPLVSSRTYGFYGQDDFRVTPHLTLNLGLRYELPEPASDRHNRFDWIDLSAKSPLQSGVNTFMAANPQVNWSTVCPACSNLTGGYVYASSSQRHAYNTDANNLGPRIGLAYQFRPHMVFRAGYGVYYGLNSGQNTGELGDGFTVSTPYIPSTDNEHTQYASIVNPFPNGIVQPTGPSLGLMQTVGSTIFGPVRDIGISPNIQEWSASVERELGFNSVVEVSYSASKGTHLGFGTDRRRPNLIDPKYESLGSAIYNQVPNPFYGLVPATADMATPTVQAIQLLRPHPQFDGIAERPGPPTGNSIYHSMTLRFTKRTSHGLQMTAHYTYAKLIDDSESADDPNLDWLESIGGGRTRVQNWGDLSAERSPSVIDITHRFVTDFTYQLPVGHGKKFGATWNRALDAVAGGWQVNGFVIASNGVPLHPALNSWSDAESGQGYRQRPNLLSNPCVGGGSIESKLGSYLNPSAFSQPAPFTWGTAPRTMGFCRAPGYHGSDMSMFKQIYFDKEHSRYLELRLESLNWTNTPIFSTPGTTFGSGSYGIITGQANSPRTVQLGGKIYF